MLIPKPIVFAAAAILATYAVVLVLVVPDAWNDYQHGFSTGFRNVTDDRLCFKYSSCSAEIKPHETSYWDAAGSCSNGTAVKADVVTSDGDVVYSVSANCEDWAGSTIIINKRDGQYVVSDDLPPVETPR